MTKIITHIPRRQGPGRGIAGEIELCHVFPDGWRRPAARQANQIQDTWGFIVAKLLGFGDNKYKINAMYIEFENVDDPEDPVTLPTNEPDETVGYYDDLSLSSSRDFLRVPLLVAPGISVVSGFEDVFEAGQGNKLTFFTQTQGVAGVHGRGFSSGDNSKVYGVALAATPVFADRTQDVILARSYLAADRQVLKELTPDVGVTWHLLLT